MTKEEEKLLRKISAYAQTITHSTEGNSLYIRFMKAESTPYMEMYIVECDWESEALLSFKPSSFIEIDKRLRAATPENLASEKEIAKLLFDLSVEYRVGQWLRKNM